MSEVPTSKNSGADKSGAPSQPLVDGSEATATQADLSAPGSEPIETQPASSPDTSVLGGSDPASEEDVSRAEAEGKGAPHVIHDEDIEAGGPGLAFFAHPVRKIIEFLKLHNAKAHHVLAPGEAEEALAKKGLKIEDVDDHKPTEVEHWKALSLYSGDGPAMFNSLDGWWKGSLFPDGSFEVTKLAHTNIASRVGSGLGNGVNVDDQVFKGNSLETFIAMLQELQASGDEIIENSLAQVETRRQQNEAENAERDRLAARNPSEIPVDPDEVALSHAAAEHGFGAIRGDALILKLASAYGIPLAEPVMVDEVDDKTGEPTGEKVQGTTNAHDHTGGVMMRPDGEPYMVPEWGPARPIADVRADVLAKIGQDKAA